MQCLHPKPKHWTPELDDEDFELESKYCFLTGLGTAGLYDDGIYVQGVRHGVDTVDVDNTYKCVRPNSLFRQHVMTDDPITGHPDMPFHPHCFQMFKKLSIQRFGKVDIDGLWLLRAVRMHILCP